MNVAYLTYQYVPNPKGLPDTWPAEVVELGDGTTPPGDNWVVVSHDDYLAYVAGTQSQYDVWQAANPGPGQPVTTENYEVNTYNSKGVITSTAWFANKVTTGVYTVKAREIVYTLDSTSSAVLSSVESTYDTNGHVLTSVTHTYLSSTTQVILEKSSS